MFKISPTSNLIIKTTCRMFNLC